MKSRYVELVIGPMSVSTFDRCQKALKSEKTTTVFGTIGINYISRDCTKTDEAYSKFDCLAKSYFYSNWSCFYV